MASSDQLRPPEISKCPPNGATSLISDGMFPPLNFADSVKAKPDRRFPPIRLAARQYGLKDGKPSISFTPAELQAGVDNLKHTLVAKFSGGRPHIDEVRRAFLATWGLSGQCSVGAWDACHILIVLDSEADTGKVLAHPMRKLGHALFRVFRWSKDFNTKIEPSITDVWIRLPSLPPEMFNQGYIEPIVASIGRFLAIDNRTSDFNNLCFARACIELDITSILPDKVWIATGADSGFWQGIEYEHNLLYCSNCKLHGHNLTNCRKTMRRSEEEDRIWVARDGFGLPTGAPTTVTAPQAHAEPTKASLPKQASSLTPSEQTNEWTFVQKRKGKQSKSQKDQLAYKGAGPQARIVSPSLPATVTGVLFGATASNPTLGNMKHQPGHAMPSPSLTSGTHEESTPSLLNPTPTPTLLQQANPLCLVDPAHKGHTNVQNNANPETPTVVPTPVAPDEAISRAPHALPPSTILIIFKEPKTGNTSIQSIIKTKQQVGNTKSSPSRSQTAHSPASPSLLSRPLFPVRSAFLRG